MDGVRPNPHHAPSGTSRVPYLDRVTNQANQTLITKLGYNSCHGSDLLLAQGRKEKGWEVHHMSVRRAEDEGVPYGYFWKGEERHNPSRPVPHREGEGQDHHQGLQDTSDKISHRHTDLLFQGT